MNCVFIGGGNMASAILSIAIQAQVLSPTEVTIIDKSPMLTETLSKKFPGVSIATSNQGQVECADVVVLAVKPQNLTEVSRALRGTIQPGALLISILAGVSIARLDRAFGAPRIIRVMPNLPVKVAKGVSVWAQSDAVTDEQVNFTTELLGATGFQMQVADEGDIDRATAVSGSGPGYIFAFMEALESAAVGLGFAPDIARQLVSETLTGAAALSATEPDFARLRQAVTSKGGTTEAALNVMTEHDLKNIVKEAVTAAIERSQALSES